MFRKSHPGAGGDDSRQTTIANFPREPTFDEAGRTYAGVGGRLCACRRYVDTTSLATSSLEADGGALTQFVERLDAVIAEDTLASLFRP